MIFLAIASMILPQPADVEIVAATLILEAGGESKLVSLEAVNEVILNRAERRNMSPKEVCLQRKQFSCWNNVSITRGLQIAKSHPRWKYALMIAKSPKTNYVKGADHYHALHVSPYWVPHMRKTVQIEHHIFYKS